MSPKGNPKPTSDELLAQFDDLGVDGQETQQQSTSTTPAATNTSTTAGQNEQDILAELDTLASQRPSSGPGTPRLSTAEPRSSSKSPRPPAGTGRPSEDRPPVRKSGESGRSSRTGNRNTAQQPSTEDKTAEEPQQGGDAGGSGSDSGGGWFGGFFATASAAMKQAEAAVKEIQQNEEAQKWAQQVKGNVGALKELGN